MSFKAMVLAAGKGTRLMPLTASIPKPMLPFNGKPVLQHVVEGLARFDVRRLVINLHHNPEVVRRHFGDGSKWGVSIIYSYEAQLLGTAGATNKVAALFDEPFFVIYGDNLTTCNLDRMRKLHANNKACATVALFQRNETFSSGVAEFDSAGRIRRFVEKPAAGETSSNWVNAGVLLFEPEVHSFIPPDVVSDFARDILPALISAGKRVYAYCMRDEEHLSWIDTPEDYRQVCMKGRNVP